MPASDRDPPGSGRPNNTKGRYPAWDDPVLRNNFAFGASSRARRIDDRRRALAPILRLPSGARSTGKGAASVHQHAAGDRSAVDAAPAQTLLPGGDPSISLNKTDGHRDPVDP